MRIFISFTILSLVVNQFIGLSNSQTTDVLVQQCVQLVGAIQQFQNDTTTVDFTQGGFLKTQGTISPQPQEQNSTEEYLVINEETFSFTVKKETCSIIEAAILRYEDLIFKRKSKSKCSFSKRSNDDQHGLLTSLEIIVDEPCENEYPSPNMDESYELKINSEDCPGKAVLIANSAWGFLRGMESFSQLIYRKANKLVVNTTSIKDWPRFPYRGVLLDTSRHYFGVKCIKQLLDTMSWFKFNVFHWHIVDDPSFPYQSEKFPNLSKAGAFDPKTHIYTKEDIECITNYARRLGIRVIVEFDTPDHTRSWIGVPGLLTQCYTNDSNGNLVPNGFDLIDPTKASNFEVLDALFTEAMNLFKDKYFHIGGDEVVLDCWKSNPDVKKFMFENGFGEDYMKLFIYFQEKLLSLVKAKNKIAMIWEEGAIAGTNLGGNAIVQVWHQPSGDKVKNLTSRGFEVVVNDIFYLNYNYYGRDWPLFYLVDPVPQGMNPEQIPLILGGEASLWTEFMDCTNVFQIFLPRGIAVAERLWSSYLVRDYKAASPRFEEARCKIISRGIPAISQNGPSYCDDDDGVCSFN